MADPGSLGSRRLLPDDGYSAIDKMEPRDAYQTGFRAGGSDLLADVNTLCDQLGIDLDGRHEFEAIRATIQRLRAENDILWSWAPSQAAREIAALPGGESVPSGEAGAFDWHAAALEQAEVLGAERALLARLRAEAAGLRERLVELEQTLRSAHEDDPYIRGTEKALEDVRAIIAGMAGDEEQIRRAREET